MRLIQSIVVLAVVLECRIFGLHVLLAPRTFDGLVHRLVNRWFEVLDQLHP